jgi:hypothetical protein
MPHTRYIIVRHEDEWLIKFGDGEYGPYRSQAEAMRVAIDAAQKLGRCGPEARRAGRKHPGVHDGRAGPFPTGMDYGQDPYPPRDLASLAS